MPDKDGQSQADPETLPETSLHAYKEGRKDEVSGDAEDLESSDRDKHHGQNVGGEGEFPLPTKKDLRS